MVKLFTSLACFFLLKFYCQHIDIRGNCVPALLSCFFRYLSFRWTQDDSAETQEIFFPTISSNCSRNRFHGRTLLSYNKCVLLRLPSILGLTIPCPAHCRAVSALRERFRGKILFIHLTPPQIEMVRNFKCRKFAYKL